MKVLIVASYNKGRYAPFIEEQVQALRAIGVDCEYYGIVGKGITGYFRNIFRLKKAIRQFHPDIIHAHYGLSGLLANLQRSVPVVTTYHGSDINDPAVFRFSRIAIALSHHNIFVSQKNIDTAAVRHCYSLVPCGVNIDLFSPRGKEEARKKLGWPSQEKVVVFAGAFDNTVKNAPLAKAAMQEVPNATLMELKGFSREEMAMIMSAADVLLMTSHTEGSPQVIKEAMASGCPIVSVDVGDVKQITEGIAGCYITENDASSLAHAICRAISHSAPTEGRSRIIQLKLDHATIAERILHIYNQVIG